MNRSKTLGLVLLAPALIIVILLFFLPVTLTAVFSLTNMSTATGIHNGSYQITQTTLESLKVDHGMTALANQLKTTRYTIDQSGLNALQKAHPDAAYLHPLGQKFLGHSFTHRRQLTRVLRQLDGTPRSTYKLNKIARYFQRSVGGRRFADKEEMLSEIKAIGISLSPAERKALISTTYTGWIWTAENYRRMFNLPDTGKALTTTLIYVFSTLVLFNIGFALILAIATHYMPERVAGIYRGLWLLPRITPPVLYVLLWKWMAWDTGFLSTLLAQFGVPARNWMLDSVPNAWIFIILINGFVGASMGMLVLSAAIRAIPQTQFWASEVDGANRLQQIRHIILPQLRWPILFMTCYQTLSLLASYEYILLATNGGPGTTTEVWSLLAYHTALKNYAGNLQYGYGAALAMVLVALGIILSLLYLKLFGFGKMMTKPKIEL
jgi:inositol-phosphate transport system permease protein